MSGRGYTEADVSFIREHYPDMPTWAVAMHLGRSERAIHVKASHLGVSKSDRFLASDWCHKKNDGSFSKGHEPHNKGRKGWQAGGRSAETRFRTGNRPHTWAPVGSTRLQDGYLQVKVADTGYTPRDFRSVHVMLWEEHNGPIPDGHCVVFRNGNKEDIRIENLELVSRGELMKRNTIHNLPEELVDVIRIKGVLSRHINRLGGGGDEEQDRGSQEPPVCDHRGAAGRE